MFWQSMLEEDLKYETATLESATPDMPSHHVDRVHFYRAQTLFELQRYVEAVKDYRVVVDHCDPKVVRSAIQVSLYKLGVCERILASTNLTLKGQEYFWRSVLAAVQLSNPIYPSPGFARWPRWLINPLDPLLELASIYQEHLKSNFLAKICLQILLWFDEKNPDCAVPVDVKTCRDKANDKLKQLDSSECMDHSAQLLMEMYLSDQEWENQVCDNLLSRFPEINRVYSTFK